MRWRDGMPWLVCGAMTANRTARREDLVEAAMHVLRTHGLAACTARAIAEASPLTKSALHYYFEDVEEIVDVAFRRLMGEFQDQIDAAAAAQADPVAALWAAVETHLHLGADRPERGEQLLFLWFEMQVAASRRGDTSTVAALTDRALGTFTRLVAAAGVDRAEALASTLLSALIGSVVRLDMHPRPISELIDELASTLALPAPARL
jgi:AcrR family transcriptional regulator